MLLNIKFYIKVIFICSFVFFNFYTKYFSPLKKIHSKDIDLFIFVPQIQLNFKQIFLSLKKRNKKKLLARHKFSLDL